MLNVAKSKKWYEMQFFLPFYENFQQIGRVWKRDLPTSPDLTWLEQCWMTILLVLRAFSLSEMIKWWMFPLKGASDFRKKQFIDAYAAIKFAVLLAMALCGCRAGVWAIVVAVLLVETVGATLYAQFVGYHDDGDAVHSPNRSIVLLFMGYGNLIAGFAVLYLWTGAISVGTDPACGNTIFLTSPLDALYFSCVTSTTLGYGEFLPKDYWSKAFVMIQTLSGFLLLALMLAVFVNLLGCKRTGNANGSPN